MSTAAAISIGNSTIRAELAATSSSWGVIAYVLLPVMP